MPSAAEELVATFNAVDTDGSGDISHAELKAYVTKYPASKRKLGIGDDDHDGKTIHQIFKELKGGSTTGRITLEKFAEAVGSAEQVKVLKAIEKVFNQIDTDKSGTLNHMELTVWFQKHPEAAASFGLTKSNIHDLWKAMDFNGDAAVNLSEFVRTITVYKFAVQKLEPESKSAPTPAEELVATFNAIDTDGGGDISHAELKAYVTKYPESKRKLGIGDDDHEGKTIHQIFKELKGDSTTGRVTLERFAEAVGSVEQVKTLKAIEKVFNQVDTDNSGTLSHKELQVWFKNHPNAAASFGFYDSDLKAVWKQMDMNGDNDVGLSEFVRTIAVHKFALDSLGAEPAPQVANTAAEELVAIFDAVDTDGSGAISHAELKAYILANEDARQKLGFTDDMMVNAKTMKKPLKELWKRLDVAGSNDGLVTLAAFAQAVGSAEQVQMLMSIKVVFDQIDEDNSGTLSKEELQNWFAANPEAAATFGLYDSNLQAVWKTMDFNGDSSVTLSEFVRTITLCKFAVKTVAGAPAEESSSSIMWDLLMLINVVAIAGVAFLISTGHSLNISKEDGQHVSPGEL